MISKKANIFKSIKLEENTVIGTSLIAANDIPDNTIVSRNSARIFK